MKASVRHACILLGVPFLSSEMHPSTVSAFTTTPPFSAPCRPLSLSCLATSSALISDGTLVTTETFSNRYKDYLPPWLLQRCHDLGYIHPTRIQQEALDAIFQIGMDDHDDSGETAAPDVVIQAETGSGKTLCYLLPTLAAIDPRRSTVQAMIVVPTRELGLQVAHQAKRLAAAAPSASLSETNNDASRKSKLYVMSVLQGSQNRRQRAWAWAEPPQLVIGTPTELSQMVTQGGIKRYNNIQRVVVDEVDACLLNNAGSLQLSATPLHELLSKHLSHTYLERQDNDDDGWSGTTSKRKYKGRQTILLSATIPQHRHFLRQCVSNKWTAKEPILVSLQKGELMLPPTLQHMSIVVLEPSQKFAALKRYFKKIIRSSEPSKVLVFCDSNRPLEEMAQALAQEVPNGVYWQEKQDSHVDTAPAITAVLRYQDSLSQRAAAMDAFVGQNESSADEGSESDTQVRVLFSTDLAARGLDVPEVTHVIHFDLPLNADTYVHRAGRTGRLGRVGLVVSIVALNQEFVLQRLANKLSLELTCVARQKPKK